jgi:hypothetical protein
MPARSSASGIAAAHGTERPTAADVPLRNRAAGSWWRIEVRTVDNKPRVVSCEPVEASECAKENRRTDVFFVQAGTKEAAGRKAWNAYTGRLGKIRRARYIAEGRCGYCGRANDRESGKRCSVCLKSHAAHRARHDAKARGEAVPPANRAASVAARAEEQRQQIRAEAAGSTRLSVLLEVQEAWQDSSTNGAFTKWMKTEIEKLLGRRVA